MTKTKPRVLSVPNHHPADSPEAPPELLEFVRMDTPTGERSLTNIHPHPNPTRSLDPRHLVDLARSIGALGLIHPLVIDVEDVVVAGSHRYAALRLLSAHPDERVALLASLCPAAYAGTLAPLAEPVQLLAVSPGVVDFMRIPVRVLPLSMAKNPDDAWRAEVAENEQRRDYKPSEVKELARRLEAQGYTMRKGGRLDPLRVLPVLSALVGKSDRQIRRILLAADAPEDNRSDVRLPKRTKLAVDASAALKAVEKLKATHAKIIGAGDHTTLNRAVDVLKRLAQS